MPGRRRVGADIGVGVVGSFVALVLLAGVGAGVINTIVGSGTLITFPTLVAFGVPPVTATMSNAKNGRPTLAGQIDRVLRSYPELTDDEWVAERRARAFSGKNFGS